MGRKPLECVTVIMPDITEYLDFGIYYWVVFKQNTGVVPSKLVRWIEVLHRVRKLLIYWVLTKSGISISCCIIQKLKNPEKQTNE